MDLTTTSDDEMLMDGDGAPMLLLTFFYCISINIKSYRLLARANKLQFPNYTHKWWLYLNNW